MPNGVKWIKIATDIFDNRKIKYLRRLPNGDSNALLWIMMLTMAGRSNADGKLLLTERIPYSADLIAAEIGIDAEIVNAALPIFVSLDMITIEDSVISITGWSEHQSAEALDKIKEQARARVAKYREKKENAPQNGASSLHERYNTVTAPLHERYNTVTTPLHKRYTNTVTNASSASSSTPAESLENSALEAKSDFSDSSADEQQNNSDSVTSNVTTPLHDRYNTVTTPLRERYSNADVTQCNATDIDIERDIDIDIDKDIDDDLYKEKSSKENAEAFISDYIEKCKDFIATIPKTAIADIQEYINKGMTAERFEDAWCIAYEKDCKSWQYFKSVLKSVYEQPNYKPCFGGCG